MIFKSNAMRKLLVVASIFFMADMFMNAEETRTLTLEESISLGIENSKTLKVSESKKTAAESKSDEISAGMLPSLKFTGGYTRLSNLDYPDSIIQKYGTGPLRNFTNPQLNNYSAKLSLSQPIFTGFKLSASSDISDYNLKASEADYDKDKSQLVYDIKNNYWTVFSALEMLKSLDENIVQLKAHLTDVESMSKAGLATNNDILKVKVQLTNLEFKKLEAESNILVGFMALNNLLGLPLDTKLELNEKVGETSYVVPSLAELKTSSLQTRNEIKGMEYRVKAGEMGIKAAKAAYYPQVALTANYLLGQPNSRYMATPDEFADSWDVGLTLSFDIWNWGTAKHQTDQAREVYEQTKLSLEQIKDAIQLEVSQSYLNYVKSLEKLPVARTGIEQAEENVRVTREKFKSGLATNTDVIDAEVALLTSRINLTTALVDIELAKARLEKSIGK